MEEAVAKEVEMNEVVPSATAEEILSQDPTADKQTEETNTEDKVVSEEAAPAEIETPEEAAPAEIQTNEEAVLEIEAELIGAPEDDIVPVDPSLKEFALTGKSIS